MVLGGAGAISVAVAEPSDKAAPPATAEPVKIHSVKLKDRGKGKKGVDRRTTEPFSLVGISWPKSRADLEGRAQVRTRSAETGEWSAWHTLGTDIEAPESPEGKDRNARGATEPRWVGASDGVEARVLAEDGTATAGLPGGMRLDLIDPGVTKKEARQANKAGTQAPSRIAVDELPGGMKPAGFTAHAPAAAKADTTASPSPSPDGTTSPEPSPGSTTSSEPTGSTSPSASTSTSSEPTATASPSPTETTPVAPPSTVTRPPIVTRAQWGADESKVEEPSNYLEDGIKAVFVHHTTDSNSYSCAQSPAIVRAIMTYHIESNGWNDLGYNFLVDKCGTIFEGRHGGIDLPVYGAHTYGFNSYSTGISVIGNYEERGAPPARVTDAVARLAAWKLGQYGGDPEGQVTLEALGDTGVWSKGDQATLNVISGHRDAYATACPGESLYGKLGEIRRFAGSPAASSAVPTADLNRDGLVEMAAGMPQATAGGASEAGMVSILPGGINGPVKTPTTLDQDSAGVPDGTEAGDHFGESTAYGDLNHDGHADLVVGVPGEETGGGAGDHGAVNVLYGPDLTTGAELLAPEAERTGGAHFGQSVEVADVDSDGYADVVVTAPGAPGSWYLFDGETLNPAGSGTLGDTAYSGDTRFPAATSADFDRDGYADVAVNFRDPDGRGRVVVLNGSSSGLQRDGILSTLGGRSVDAGDTDGDGYPDLAIGQPYASESDAVPGGQVTVVRGSSGGLTTSGLKTVDQDTPGVPGGVEGGDAFGFWVSVGDTNDDNRAEVLVGAPREDLSRDGEHRSNAGMINLLYGASGGVTGDGAHGYSQNSAGIPGATEDEDRFGSSVQLADVTGWGRTDLAIGVDGENNQDGGVVTIPAGSAGIDPQYADFVHPSDFGSPAGAKLGYALKP
ncbi:N-acetylmuramoyl-L-alanine amidase [Streptomyces sp. JJ36]|uniref:N-acetylmuramoyl-L-alanine amidase n=1 Tax=Streptomyces sp. JJ36 TaxID=2736645 RepID=UPI001F00D6CF|nr:N-acetylmuramoyl-L-alanine amidase [Streptomyces sp. JJ36]MCF6525034.1 FG-GAP repeat protein [Streptomyces sp. JJ36]